MVSLSKFCLFALLSNLIFYILGNAVIHFILLRYIDEVDTVKALEHYASQNLPSPFFSLVWKRVQGPII